MEGAPTRVNQPSPVHGGRQPKKNMSVRKITTAIVAIAIVALLVFGAMFLFRSSTSSTIDGGKYQAVFFTNGQVYFGKLRALNGDYMKLTDIYYLQAKTADAKSENPQKTEQQASSDVQLIKLGNEVHGPLDEMVISKQQILFFENLKPEGKVSQSIKSYQDTNKK